MKTTKPTKLLVVCMLLLGIPSLNAQQLPLSLEAEGERIALPSKISASDNDPESLTVFNNVKATKESAIEFPILLEAESARLFGDLKVKPTDGSTINGLSGGKYIGDFNQRANSYLQFVGVEIPEEGTYQLRVYSMGSGRRLSIKVNQYEKTIITTTDSPDWNNAPPSMVSTLIYMDKGKNTITFGSHNDDGPNLDKFEIRQTSESIEKPNVINLAYISDYTDEAEITAQHDNETLAYLTDNSEYTFYKVDGVTSAQITAKCKYPILLTGYLFSTGIGGAEDVTQWVLEVSKDGDSWTTVNPNKSTDLSGAHLFEVTRTYATAAANAAQYYRLTAKGATDVEVAEWQLFGSPYLENTSGKTFPEDITEGLAIQTKTTAYPQGGANNRWSNLFNRQLNSKYYATGTKQYSIEVDLDKEYKFDYYTLTSADAYPDRDPKKWTFNGYNDEIGWVELDRQTEFSFPSRYATMQFNIDSEISFTKFLLDVEDNSGSTSSQLLKWQLFGEELPGTGIENPTDAGYSIRSEKGKINILQREQDLLTYRIFNSSGSLITNGSLSGNQHEISVPQGMYIVQINNHIGNYSTKVFVR